MADNALVVWGWETFFTELTAFLQQLETEEGVANLSLLSMLWSICISFMSALVTYKVFSLQLKVTRGK